MSDDDTSRFIIHQWMLRKRDLFFMQAQGWKVAIDIVWPRITDQIRLSESVQTERFVIAEYGGPPQW